MCRFGIVWLKIGMKTYFQIKVTVDEQELMPVEKSKNKILISPFYLDALDKSIVTNVSFISANALVTF